MSTLSRYCWQPGKRLTQPNSPATIDWPAPRARVPNSTEAPETPSPVGRPTSSRAPRTAQAPDRHTAWPYFPDRTLQQMILGNPLTQSPTSATVETTTQNTRLQVTGRTVAKSLSNLVQLGFAYDVPGSNNGNLVSESIVTSGTQPTSVTQTFTTDAFNRLSKASETSEWSRIIPAMHGGTGRSREPRLNFHRTSGVEAATTRRATSSRRRAMSSGASRTKGDSRASTHGG